MSTNRLALYAESSRYPLHSNNKILDDILLLYTDEQIRKLVLILALQTVRIDTFW